VPAKNSTPVHASKILPTISPFYAGNRSVDAMSEKSSVKKKKIVYIYGEARLNDNNGTGQIVAL
jgi:hypothetical protein